MLYKYDPINTINFHQYFDGKENIVLVVKTSNGQFIAGFSEDSFKEGKHPQKDGLIISMTNKTTFTLREVNKNATIYDKLFIIFGNSEIRIRVLEAKVFSNFNIVNSFYNPKGHKVHSILGEGLAREVKTESYEIHQLVFY